MSKPMPKKREKKRFRYSDKQYYCLHMLQRGLLPCIISCASLSLADIADSIVVGNRIGERGLAAIGLVMPIYMLYNIIGFGLSRGGEITVSREIAEGRTKDANDSFNILFWAGLLLGCFFAAAGSVFNGPVLRVLGAAGESADFLSLCRTYYIPIILAAPVFIINYILYDLLRVDNEQYLVGIAFTCASLSDLGLNILFVLILRKGILGSAMATVIGQLLEVSIYAFHFMKHRGCLKICRPCFAVLKLLKMFKIGFASSVRYLYQFLFLMMANSLLIHRGGGNGVLYVAIFDVVINISYVTYSIFEACAEALQPLCSAYYAEQDRENLVETRRMTVLIGMVLGTALTIVIAIFTKQVSWIFGFTEPDIIPQTARAIRIFCISVPFAGSIFIYTSYYQSLEKENLALYLTTLRSLVILIPATWIIGNWNLTAFWWVFPVTEITSVIIGSLSIFITGKGKVLMDVPVVTMAIEDKEHEIADLIHKTRKFSEENHADARQTNLLQMVVEELVMVTIEQAFTGTPWEYIQVTIVAQKGGKYVLIIRSSARSFNPFDMKTARIINDSEKELMDSIGVLMIREKADEYYYRRYNNFNIQVVKL